MEILDNLSSCSRKERLENAAGDSDEEGLSHARPISGQGQIEAVKQNGYALKNAAPDARRGTRQAAHPERATDLSVEQPRPDCRGGVVPEGRSQDFSTCRLFPPVRTASPNLPGDALGVPGGGGVLGLGISEATKAPTL